MAVTPVDSRLDDVVVDVAVVGGRVIDPESRLDAVATVAISGGEIVHVGREVPRAHRTIDASGLVVAPGFIDLHSHAQSLAGARLQALDGVTTAVDLECGAVSIRDWYGHIAQEGRPINYGYSASWAAARARALGGWRPDPRRDGTGFGAFQLLSASGAWTGDLGVRERNVMTAVLRDTLDEGALGIGVLLGYRPETETEEVEGVVGLAARSAAGAFVHSRSSAWTGPVTALDAVRELVTAAERTDGHVHLCHVNSTSGRWMEEIVAALGAAHDRGIRLSTEVYPYARGSTVVGASFLSPSELRREGRSPSSLIYTPTGETVADENRLVELRRTDPGGLVLTLTFDESDVAEAGLLDRALLIPDAAFASDAMPTSEPVTPAERWPLPERAFAHPRSAGCFSRVLRELVRERSLLTLPEALRRCTVLPADILAPTAPAMRSKGRLQPGADADVVVFDPDLVSDRATYSRLATSTGVRHVLVGGCAVVRDGDLIPDALPGRPVVADRGRATPPDPQFPIPATTGGDT